LRRALLSQSSTSDDHLAAQAGAGLPERYHRLFRVWFALGWPAFIGVVAIFVLMIAKPVLW
jgi:uncharacterized membrane protein